jgi:hypothetical protein
MATIITKRRWKWIGHVLRKEPDDTTKIALYWTSEGKRKRGRPKVTWRRTVEAERKLEQPPKNSKRQTQVESPRCCPTGQRRNGQ